MEIIGKPFKTEDLVRLKSNDENITFDKLRKHVLKVLPHQTQTKNIYTPFDPKEEEKVEIGFEKDQKYKKVS